MPPPGMSSLVAPLAAAPLSGGTVSCVAVAAGLGAEGELYDRGDGSYLRRALRLSGSARSKPAVDDTCQVRGPVPLRHSGLHDRRRQSGGRASGAAVVSARSGLEHARAVVLAHRLTGDAAGPRRCEQLDPGHGHQLGRWRWRRRRRRGGWWWLGRASHQSASSRDGHRTERESRHRNLRPLRQRDRLRRGGAAASTLTEPFGEVGLAFRRVS